MQKAGGLALVFFGLLAFINALHHPFVHDDVIFILNNPHITELGAWPQAFKLPAASDGLNTYYRPVLEIINRLEYHLFGPYPFGYHLVNVIIHIMNGLLLFSLLQRLGLARPVAWAVALLFLVHPVQSEAVSCISGISNLWMALGVLMALHAYLNQWVAASFLCYALAFLGKEQAVLFVPLVVLIDYSRGKNAFGSWIFWVLSTAALLGLRHWVTGASLLKDIMVSPGELYLRLAAVPRDIEMYLRLIFFPYDLHYYRNTDILQSNAMSWALAVVLIGGIYCSFKRWPKARPVLVLGLGWFFAALLPVLNIAPLINEYSFILTPEHFLYLPIVGILIAAVCAADHLSGYFKKWSLGLVAAGCLLLTWHQNTFWASETVLFERMLKFEPDFGRGHLLLAKAYYADGRFDLAAGHFARALEIMSGYEKKAGNATARNFYLRYTNEIRYDWARNDAARGQRSP